MQYVYTCLCLYPGFPWLSGFTMDSETQIVFVSHATTLLRSLQCCLKHTRTHTRTQNPNQQHTMSVTHSSLLCAAGDVVTSIGCLTWPCHHSHDWHENQSHGDCVDNNNNNNNCILNPDDLYTMSEELYNSVGKTLLELLSEARLENGESEGVVFFMENSLHLRPFIHVWLRSTAVSRCLQC